MHTFWIVQNESVSNKRTIYLQLVDSVTLVGKSGLTAPSGRIHIFKGGATTAIAHTGTFTELSPIGRGNYAYSFDPTEIDTAGPICFSYSGGSARADMWHGYIIPNNIYSTSGFSSNVNYWANTPVPSPNFNGIPKVDLLYIGGSGIISSGIADVNITQWKGTDVPTPYITGIPITHIMYGTGIGMLNISPTGSNSIAGSVWDVPLSQHTTYTTFGGSNQPVYQMLVDFNEDDTNNRDEYTITWYKNGQSYSPDTPPNIQVVNINTGSDIVPESTMSQTPGYYGYYYNSTNRLGLGQAALVIGTATIDSESRTFTWVISRDQND
jgi:hypothetical protein